MTSQIQLRTLIVDDEPIALDKLKAYVGRVPYLSLEAMCYSGVEALERLASGDIDVVFTDISMPDLSGMEMVGALTHRPLVVFTTAYADHAADSYRVGAVDYLLKPYSFADFQRAASRVLEMWTLRHPSEVPAPAVSSRPAAEEALFIKTDTRHVRVDPAEILYIKGYGEYLQIFLTDRPQPLVTLCSFASLLARLPSNFLQVHRSYAVNMNRISHIERSRVVIAPDTYIPVSDTYRQTLLDYIR